MKTFTIARGDDEEFALSIFDPITGVLIDMTSNTAWTIELQWKSRSDSLVQTLTGGGMVINSGHADPAVLDGTVKVTITAAETLALTQGSYELWVRVLDSGPLQSHLFRGLVTMNVLTSPLSS
jgi:hypothetical protein